MSTLTLPHAEPSLEVQTAIRDLTDVTRADLPVVGGKGANLGEMIHVGLPVPTGFVITVDGYAHFRNASGIAGQVDALLRSVPVNDPSALQELSTRLRGLVLRAAIPDDLADSIHDAYERLSAAAQSNATGTPDVMVAVRSSATAEDTTAFSFAGMFESVLGVQGFTALADAIRVCWASTFGARVLYYRLTRGMPSEMPVAVIVQQMIASEKSGVIFTVDPATRDATHVVIEAAWGVGEVVVGGQVTPDHYVVDKATGRVIERTTPRKDFLIEPLPTGGMHQVDLSTDPRMNAPVLGDAEIAELVSLARKSETHYGAPQDMEFAIANSRIYLTQTRPITTLTPAATPSVAATSAAPASGPAPVLHGMGASPGMGTGPVRILQAVSESAALRPGEILVTRMTSPDWVPLMRRAAGIVTDEGGMTSHAAIVSRELGIPCVVGTRDATRILHDGMVVTVNGREGTVTEGASPPAASAPHPTPREGAISTGASAPIVTATRLYVNLAEPERAADIAQRDVDGVGLLRAEFMMLSALDGMHPREMLARGGGDDFVRRMAEKLHLFASAFDPRPVIYRAMDFRSNEFRKLTGGAAHEPEEENPMIGYRGCFRYTREPDLFALELRALSEVRKDFSNLHLMLPFVRTGWEMTACRALIDASPLGKDRRMQLWIMAEVPSVVSWMEDYARAGVTGVSIGSNDLTQLMLGVDRDSAMLAPFYDERDRAVLDAIHTIITRSHELGMTCSICGQAPSVHPEYAAQLVEWGIDSISVNPDAIEQTRRNIAAAEQRVILAASRRTLLSRAPSFPTAH
ncbi:MAG: phosphoenolpyruvate synthase [Gemmatimonadota bacterium]